MNAARMWKPLCLMRRRICRSINSRLKRILISRNIRRACRMRNNARICRTGFMRACEAGYSHYEVSAYAQPHQRCWHNLNYWQFGDYLGIGAGAHSKLSFPQRIVRQMRYKQPAAYLRQCAENAPIQQEYAVNAEDLPFEFMLNALRLTQGFPVHWFSERTGLPIRAIEQPLRTAIARGLLTRDHQMIIPTPLGQRFLSDLQALFLE